MERSLQEKLVILLDKATNPHSSELDVATIDSFCCTVKNEASLTVFASKLLADRIQSVNANESLNALNLLDECMAKCGERFQSTVGTFRFLNELVKLVSLKYLGGQTDVQVKTKILDLLLLWTVQYPKESKIKEAYEMLRRQGVDHESPNPIRVQKKTSVASQSAPKQPEDPTSMKIKELIQSKNPGKVDIHAANLLIQNFYEIEKKKTLRVQEIKKGKENVFVLNEMLDNFSVSESSSDDIALIRELYESCKCLQPTILLLTEDPNQDEQVLQEALETNDLLMHIVQKYESIMQANGSSQKPNGSMDNDKNVHDDVLIDMQMDGRNAQEVRNELESSISNDMNALVDIFGNIPSEFNAKPMVTSDLDHSIILAPENVSQTENTLSHDDSPGKGALENVVVEPKTTPKEEIDLMISEMLKSTSLHQPKLPSPVEHDFKDITVDLESIQPSELPPKTILNQSKGLKVILNFTKEHPKEDIAVIVATVANQGPNLITELDLHLQPDRIDYAVKQLEPAVRSLAGVKPFRAAVEDLALIILVSNPKRVDVSNWTVTVEYLSNGEKMQEKVTVDLPNLF